MKAARPLATLGMIAGYLGVAALIVGFLVIRASGGALLGRAEKTYGVVLPKVSGVEPDKTSVLTPSGVTIGVVTDMRLSTSNASLQVKLSEPYELHRDASAGVITKTIIGEKAVVLYPGSASQPPLRAGAKIRRVHKELSDPSDALDPLVAAVDKLAPLDAGALLQQLQDQIGPTVAQLDSLLAEVEAIKTGIGNQDGVAARLLTRTSALVGAVASRDAEITAIVDNLTRLSIDLNDLVADNLGAVGQILDLTTQLADVLASKETQLAQALDAFPGIVDKLNVLLDSAVRLLNGEKDRAVQVYVTNLPEIDQMLTILKEGR